MEYTEKVAHMRGWDAADSLGSLAGCVREGRRPSPHAGMPCCGITSDGIVCGARISPQNFLKTRFPLCLPCYQRHLNTGDGVYGPRFFCVALAEQHKPCGKPSAPIKPAEFPPPVPLCSRCLHRWRIIEHGSLTFPSVLAPLLRGT